MYLFVLGRNFDLSRAELSSVCIPIEEDRTHHLCFADSLNYQNPRDLPREENQLLLDRLGGTIRFGKVIGDNLDGRGLLELCWETLAAEEKRKIGFTVFATGSNGLLAQLIRETKAHAKDSDLNWRIENYQRKNLNSGQIFERRLLQKGMEFLVYQRSDGTFTLAKTIANQNLRNYDLRDRKKPWRDPKMGMLPPRLAQILVNLALSSSPGLKNAQAGKPGLCVIDPFCGSGTIPAEAAILGHSCLGGDLNPEFIKGARENFQFLSEKFRFEVTGQEFVSSDVRDLDWGNLSGVVATEGWLGENFEKRPSRKTIEENALKVSTLWEDIFAKLKDSPIESLAFCLPAWKFHEDRISISQKVLQCAAENGYESVKAFDGQDSFIYERDGAFVGREICVVKKR